jgi:cystathionine beta-lyase
MAGESSKKANAAGKAAIPLDIDGHNLPPSPAPSSPRNGRKYALMTELVYTESSDQYNASSVPIYQVCDTELSRAFVSGQGLTYAVCDF